ncbi:MAG: YfiR family protein, partial [Geminicoccaceae bacterium]|nr:YfiR family protein [Geminicoccaceae bacterium]
MTTLALLVVVAILVMATTARAEPTEAQIKAAYLYNFAKFVEWPDQPANGRFNICIDGDTEIIDAAATLEDKTVAG